MPSSSFELTGYRLWCCKVLLNSVNTLQVENAGTSIAFILPDTGICSELLPYIKCLSLETRLHRPRPNLQRKLQHMPSMRASNVGSLSAMAADSATSKKTFVSFGIYPSLTMRLNLSTLALDGDTNARHHVVVARHSRW